MIGPSAAVGEAEGGRCASRFVVDVISGTSAGGINGVCLAKALANGTTVAGLKKLWLTDGDIAGLVNDRSSVYEPGDDGRAILDADHRPLAGLHGDLAAEQRPHVRPPRHRASARWTTQDPDNVPPLVDELDLYVTATDLDRQPATRTQLWNTDLVGAQAREPLPLPPRAAGRPVTTSSAATTRSSRSPHAAPRRSRSRSRR